MGYGFLQNKSVKIVNDRNLECKNVEHGELLSKGSFICQGHGADKYKRFRRAKTA